MPSLFRMLSGLEVDSIRLQITKIIGPGRKQLDQIPGEVRSALDAVNAVWQRGLVLRRLEPEPGATLSGLVDQVRAGLRRTGEDEGLVGLGVDSQGILRWHLPGVAAPAGAASATLHPAPQPPDSASPREETVHFFRLPSLDETAQRTARSVEVGSKKPGLKPFPVDLPLDLFRMNRRLSAADVEGGGRTLLLVHGIFDRMFGFAFLPLLCKPAFLKFLRKTYGDRVFGFDHYTVWRSPRDNAREILDVLPRGLDLDIVCHSRGGLVVRALLEDPELRAKLDERRIRVRNAVFVAAANQGSTLAERANLERLISIYTNQLVAPRTAVPGLSVTKPALELLVRTLSAVVRAGVALPGVDSLAPGSPLIQRLNASPVEPAGRYSFVRSNFGSPSSPLFRGLNEVADGAFEGKPNDLVVPFDGAIDVGPARNGARGPILDFGTHGTQDPSCFHLDFLNNDRVLEFIQERLSEG